MAEFETGGHVYRTDKMNARDQLHLLRGLGPLLGPMVQMALMNVEGNSDARRVAVMGPFFESFAKMEEHEVNILVSKCFAVTHRREGTNGSNTWGPPLWNAVSGRDQYSDYDLMTLITICWHVIQDNLGGFFATGQGLSTSGIAAPPTPPA
jgi:hypothetical protein